MVYKLNLMSTGSAIAMVVVTYFVTQWAASVFLFDHIVFFSIYHSLSSLISDKPLTQLL
jgi:hypothetical protein